jgi:tRNA modification GTPase
VRVSGAETSAILGKIFTPRGKISPRRLTLGVVRGSDGATLDECAVIYSPSPRSYTGEDTAELHCHGSPVALSAVLRAVLQSGARMAQPGEFTRRAFLNGKMDLAQAEAVADLIDAETESAAKNAASQLGGALSRRAVAAYDGVVDILAHFYAAVDYADEDIEEFSANHYAETLDSIAADIKSLTATYERGRVMKNGIPCAIVGRANAGKSSLYNAILGYDRAIVTPEAGTTRDTIEDRVVIGGALLRLLDTAGLRDERDSGFSAAERMGIERSMIAARDADVVIAVFDGSERLNSEDSRVLDAISDEKYVVAAVNKSDLPQELDLSALQSRFARVVCVSALTGDGVEALCDAVAKFLGDIDAKPGEIVTSERQFDALTRAERALSECAVALRGGVTPDAALSLMESAVGALGETLGRSLRGDTVERVFARFCVGK